MSDETNGDADEREAEAESEQETEAFILRCIEDPGWSVQCFEFSEEKLSFAYTVGLTQSFGHPELIVFGYPSRLAIAVLNIVAERIQEGARFVDGASDDEILVEYTVHFRQVHSPDNLARYASYAHWYYQQQQTSFALLQLVWPDRDRNYPDSPGAPAWLVQSQPLLS